jgi:hypothetical protein
MSDDSQQFSEGTPHDKRSKRRAAARALAEAIHRPPLRVEFRHEPADRIDAYPTVRVSPCGIATALGTLERVTRSARSTLLIEGGRALTAGESTLSQSRRESLRGAVVGASLMIDISGAIDVVRSTGGASTVVRIEGPVDAGDAAALELAVSSGTMPLDADLRASAVVQLGGECERWSPVWAQFRELDAARAFVARLIVLYVSRVTRRPVAALPLLDLSTLPRLGGLFMIRPRDIRSSGPTTVVPVRAATGRAIVKLTLDRTTERWYV